MKWKAEEKRNTVVSLLPGYIQIQMDKKIKFGPVEYKINAELCGTSTSASDSSPRSKFYCQVVYHSGLIWRNYKFLIQRFWDNENAKSFRTMCVSEAQVCHLYWKFLQCENPRVSLWTSANLPECTECDYMYVPVCVHACVPVWVHGWVHVCVILLGL